MKNNNNNAEGNVKGKISTVETTLFTKPNNEVSWVITIPICVLLTFVALGVAARAPNKGRVVVGVVGVDNNARMQQVDVFLLTEEVEMCTLPHPYPPPHSLFLFPLDVMNTELSTPDDPGLRKQPSRPTPKGVIGGGVTNSGTVFSTPPTTSTGGQTHYYQAPQYTEIGRDEILIIATTERVGPRRGATALIVPRCLPHSNNNTSSAPERRQQWRCQRTQ